MIMNQQSEKIKISSKHSPHQNKRRMKLNQNPEKIIITNENQFKPESMPEREKNETEPEPREMPEQYENDNEPDRLEKIKFQIQISSKHSLSQNKRRMKLNQNPEKIYLEIKISSSHSPCQNKR